MVILFILNNCIGFSFCFLQERYSKMLFLPAAIPTASDFILKEKLSKFAVIQNVREKGKVYVLKCPKSQSQLFEPQEAKFSSKSSLDTLPEICGLLSQINCSHAVLCYTWRALRGKWMGFDRNLSIMLLTAIIFTAFDWWSKQRQKKKKNTNPTWHAIWNTQA